MNNNTFVQLLMDIGEKKNKTKFKSKRIKRNYLLARKRCYERIRIIAKKKRDVQIFDTNHLRFQRTIFTHFAREKTKTKTSSILRTVIRDSEGRTREEKPRR